MTNFWKKPPSSLSLSKQDVHIWQAALDLPSSTVQELREVLTNDEKARAEQFHFDRDKQRFIAARGMLREILAFYLEVKAGELRFDYGRNDKPKLSDTFGNKAICFNLSHSQGIALYGLTQGRAIGVDIEYIRDISEIEQIVEQFFSTKENDLFRTLPENLKKETFFNCWTRKEAFVKAVGDGLSFPLDKFDVSLSPGEPARLMRIEGDSKAPSRWTIHELKPSSGFAAAFAVEGRSWQLHCWQWSG
jgi:4'-phosphopantetheinyl transferase